MGTARAIEVTKHLSSKHTFPCLISFWALHCRHSKYQYPFCKDAKTRENAAVAWGVQFGIRPIWENKGFVKVAQIVREFSTDRRQALFILVQKRSDRRQGTARWEKKVRGTWEGHLLDNRIRTAMLCRDDREELL